MWKIQPKHAYDIGRTAQKLAAWTRQMDTTRVVTANCILPSISFESGYIDALDMAGFSYRRMNVRLCQEELSRQAYNGYRKSWSVARMESGD